LAEDLTYRGELDGAVARELDTRTPQAHHDPVDVAWARDQFSGSGSMLWTARISPTGRPAR